MHQTNVGLITPARQRSGLQCRLLLSAPQDAIPYTVQRPARLFAQAAILALVRPDRWCALCDTPTDFTGNSLDHFLLSSA